MATGRNMKQAKCGNCGCTTATVSFDQQDGEHPFIRLVQLACTKCESRTNIAIFPQVKLRVCFPEDEGEKDIGIFFT